jgi:hypothetical protein
VLVGGALRLQGDLLRRRTGVHLEAALDQHPSPCISMTVSRPSVMDRFRIRAFCQRNGNVGVWHNYFQKEMCMISKVHDHIGLQICIDQGYGILFS